MTNSFTMEARLCDDQGMVSHEPVQSPDQLRSEWTYIAQLSYLRSRTPGAPPYDGEPFRCTGSAHLAGEHIRCTSSAHAPVGAEATICPAEAQEALAHLHRFGYGRPGGTLTEAVALVVEEATTNAAGKRRLAEALGVHPEERWSALMIRVSCDERAERAEAELLRVRKTLGGIEAYLLERIGISEKGRRKEDAIKAAVLTQVLTMVQMKPFTALEHLLSVAREEGKSGAVKRG